MPDGKPRQRPPLALGDMTSAEWEMIAPYLATGSFCDAGRISGRHRATCERTFSRYREPIREALRQEREKTHGRGVA